MNSEEVIELSIVVPVFNELDNIPVLYGRLKKVLSENLQVTFEIIFIDDGSEDGTWEAIKNLRQQDRCIRGLRFARNFGHQYALKAGLMCAKGKAIVCMDGDLQHPPELIETFYQKWREGFLIVNSVKLDTDGVGLIKKLVISAGYFFLNLLSNTKIKKGESDFRLMDRVVVSEILAMGASDFFLRGIVNWMGYNSTWLHYTAEKRYQGISKYTYAKLFKLAISGVFSFSSVPLRVSTIIGVIIALLSFAYQIYITIMRFSQKAVIPGWTTITFLVLFLGGLILIVLGLQGEYIARIYEEMKRRPKFIVIERLD